MVSVQDKKLFAIFSLSLETGSALGCVLCFFSMWPVYHSDLYVPAVRLSDLQCYVTFCSIINWSQCSLSLCNVTILSHFSDCLCGVTNWLQCSVFSADWPPKHTLQCDSLITVFCVSLLRDRMVTVFVSLQGDHLIAQCVYNSEGRSTITLGGLTTREEMCLVFALYYPQIDMSLCHSLPSLPTVLHSLGIQELWPWVPICPLKANSDIWFDGNIHSAKKAYT